MHLSTLACTVFHFFPQSQGKETSKSIVGAHRDAQRCTDMLGSYVYMRARCQPSANQKECVSLTPSPRLEANLAFHTGGSFAKLNITLCKAHISLSSKSNQAGCLPYTMNNCPKPQPRLTHDHDPFFCDPTHPYPSLCCAPKQMTAWVSFG